MKARRNGLRLWKAGGRTGKSRHEQGWALCASLLFHVLLVLVLSTTSSFDLTIGSETRFDLFWVSPSSETPPSAAAAADDPEQPVMQPMLPEPAELQAKHGASARPQLLAAPHGRAAQHMKNSTDKGSAREPADTMAVALQTSGGPGSAPPVSKAAKTAKIAVRQKEPALPAEAANPVPPAPTAAVTDSTGREKVAEALPSRQHSQRTQTIPGFSESGPPAKQLTTPARKTQPTIEPLVAPIHEQQKAAKEAERWLQEQQKAAREAERWLQEQQKAAREAERRLQEQQKAAREAERRLQEQQKAAREAERRLQEAAEELSEQRRLSSLQSLVVASERASVPAPAPAPPVRSGPSRQHPTETRPSATPTPRGATVPIIAPSGTAAAPSQEKTAAAKPATPEASQKPPQPEGFVIASLHGDMKMVIAGESDIEVTVTFTEYPKLRRNRPLTRSEARREQRVVPVFAKAGEETREAVIETAREGIYVFSAESGQGGPAKATFTLVLFESSKREKIAAIGKRTVSGKTVLAKVLMPDGILWDDDAAFTGSLDDSDSTTKFNAQTGLYWKEYHN